MKRWLVISMLFFLLIPNLHNVKAEKTAFLDVPNTYWASKEIQWASERQLIKGYPDKTFRPNQFVTEAQFAAIFMRYFFHEQIKENNAISHWADGYYDLAKKYRLPLKGYNSEKVRNAPVSRGVVAQVLAASQGISSDLHAAIDWMYETGITVGKNPNSNNKYENFAPNENLTRAQVTVFFKRMFDKGFVTFYSSTDTKTPPPDQWVDKREKLDVSKFDPGLFYSDSYDKEAVQPTVAHYNGVSRFAVSSVLSKIWEKKFDYINSPPYTISTLNKSPVIGSDGTLYIQEGYLFGPSSQGRIFAISLNGELKWSYPVGNGRNSPVIGKNGIVYAVGYNGVFAFYPDGTLKWKHQGKGFTGLALGEDGSVIVIHRVSHPDEEKMYMELISFHADGSENWTYRFPKGVYYEGSINPIVDKNGTIYLFDSYGKVYAITKDGKLNWTLQTNAYQGSLSLDEDGTLYISASSNIYQDFETPVITNGGLYAIRPNGTLKWKYDGIDPTENSPIIVENDGFLYAAGTEVHVLNKEGKLVWKMKNEEDFGKARIAMDANHNLIVLWQLYNSMDQLMILAKNGHVKYRYTLLNAEEEVSSSPVIGHDGSIYFTVAHYDYNKMYRIGPPESALRSEK
ncbi:S-layer homology domain-containing protein [Parageobacillus toebii]|uniref:S-layer homology domain-containing protein n=1 Tax=Parageobacillus toebii TaxID=153151 RepID=UPI0035C68D96